MHQMKEEPTAPTLPARPPSFRSHQTRPQCPKLRTTPSRYPPPLRQTNFCTRQLIPLATNKIHQKLHSLFFLSDRRAGGRGDVRWRRQGGERRLLQALPADEGGGRDRGLLAGRGRRKVWNQIKKSFSKTILQHFIFQSPTPAHLLRNHLRRLRCQDRGDPPRQDVRQRPEVPRGNPGRRRRRSVRPSLPSDGDRFLLDSPGRIRVHKS